LHQLEAAAAVGTPIAAAKTGALGQRPTLVAQAPIDGLGLLLSERLEQRERNCDPAKKSNIAYP